MKSIRILHFGEKIQISIFFIVLYNSFYFKKIYFTIYQIIISIAKPLFHQLKPLIVKIGIKLIKIKI